LAARFVRTRLSAAPGIRPQQVRGPGAVHLQLSAVNIAKLPELLSKTCSHPRLYRFPDLGTADAVKCFRNRCRRWVSFFEATPPRCTARPCRVLVPRHLCRRAGPTTVRLRATSQFKIAGVLCSNTSPRLATEMIALIVSGCILTQKPKRGPLRLSLHPDGDGLFVRTGIAAVGLGLISRERGTGNSAAFVISLQNKL
jgi:hypothetical protein